MTQAAAYFSGPTVRFLEWLAPRLGPRGLPVSTVTLANLVSFAPMIARVGVEKTPADSDNVRFLFRMVGTHVDEWYAEPLTGRYVDDLDLGDWREHWLREYDRVAGGHAVCLGTVPIEWQNRDYLTVEYVYVPVVQPDGAIREVLTHTHFYLGERPSPTPWTPPGKSGHIIAFRLFDQPAGQSVP